MSDETVDLVTKDDQVIGQKKRSLLKNEDTWRAISIWITNSKGEILLQQRSMSKPHGPGLWTPAVEGTVESGHSYDETAHRELYEEIGVAGQDLVKTKKIFVSGKNFFGHRIFQVYTLLLDIDIDDLVLQEDEVAQMQWITPEALDAEIASSPDSFNEVMYNWRENFAND